MATDAEYSQVHTYQMRSLKTCVVYPAHNNIQLYSL
jgi:hypothetical protein